MPYLIYDDNTTNKAIPITNETAGFNIGRSMENDVRLREDSSVSRRHCLIFKSPDTADYILRDLGSSNGTFLNDLCLQNQQCPIRNGDLIQIGNLNFTFYSYSDNPYELVDTTTIYVQMAVPDTSPPNEYPFKDTTRLEAITPSTLASSEAEHLFPTIDGFEFISILGGGNYSTTYLVFQSSLKRTVVLKTFHTDVISESHKSLFLQQISNVGKLQHQNILGFFDAGITDTLCYVAMQYGSQGTMKTLIEQYPGGIAETDAVNYILPLVDAMVYVSDSGVLHTDISPSNILFNENSIPVIADFGLAPWILEVFQTNRNYFFGSTQHMPPEQTLDQALDWTCDQYALGAIFYELLTGVPPFSAPSAYALIEKHLRENIRFPADKQISDKTKSIIIRMMGKTPEDRFSSWQVVADAFKAKNRPSQSRKNLPLQKKGLSKIKKTGSGIKISAKKKPMTIKRK